MSESRGKLHPCKYPRKGVLDSTRAYIHPTLCEEKGGGSKIGRANPALGNEPPISRSEFKKKTARQGNLEKKERHIGKLHGPPRAAEGKTGILSERNNYVCAARRRAGTGPVVVRKWDQLKPEGRDTVWVKKKKKKRVIPETTSIGSIGLWSRIKKESAKNWSAITKIRKGGV